MKTYIALFRGINVGTNNMLPMAELVCLLEALNLHKVRTYVQSGNAVFKCTEEDAVGLSEKISQAVNQLRGFIPAVLILIPADIERAVAKNPFSQADSNPTAVHVGFLAATPIKPNLEKLAQLKNASEQYFLSERVFYLFAPDGVGRSKLAAGSEKCLGVAMTDRNWRTVRKIREMAAE